MEYRRFNQHYVVRIDKGEELISSLMQFVNKEQINLAHFQGIGAAGKVILGLFETATKTYHAQTMEGDFEITPVIGSITAMNGRAYIHAHITIGDAALKAWSGHLTEAVISATCEVFVTVLDGSVDREQNEEIGLNLLKF